MRLLCSDAGGPAKTHGGRKGLSSTLGFALVSAQALSGHSSRDIRISIPQRGSWSGVLGAESQPTQRARPCEPLAWNSLGALEGRVMLFASGAVAPPGISLAFLETALGTSAQLAFLCWPSRALEAAREPCLVYATCPWFPADLDTHTGLVWVCLWWVLVVCWGGLGQCPPLMCARGRPL